MSCKHSFVVEESLNISACEFCGAVEKTPEIFVPESTLGEDENDDKTPQDILIDEPTLDTARRLLGEGKSYREVAAELKIPKSTLYDQLHTKEFRSKGRPKLLTPNEELAACEWVEDMANAGFVVTRSLLRSKLRLLYPNKDFSTSWMSKFLKQNELTCRRVAIMEEKRFEAADVDRLRQYFSLLKETINKYKIPPKNIWNMDETGFELQDTGNYSIVKTGRKRVNARTSDNREHITVVGTVSAAGAALPPLYIFKGKKPVDDYMEHADPNATFRMQECGYLDSGIFVEYIKWLMKILPAKRPQLLLLDGYYSHEVMEALQLAAQDKIFLLCFPSHSTHLLQPLDVGVFGELKRQWKEAVSTWISQNSGTKLTKKIFVQLLDNKVWRSSLTPDRIRSSFATCGIEPFKPEVVEQRLQKEFGIKPNVPIEVAKPSKNVNITFNPKDETWTTVETTTTVALEKTPLAMVFHVNKPIQKPKRKAKEFKGLLTSADYRAKKSAKEAKKKKGKVKLQFACLENFWKPTK